MTQEKRNRVHFIGIGGIGMSALARYFLSEKWHVSGSDLSPSEITNELREEGIKFFTDHRPSNISPNIQLVVYNNAIPTDNPELRRARELGLACRTYPEVIGELTKTYKTIAIAGSHGKSTTTAMTALILIEAGLDPMVIVGTKLKEFSPTVIVRSRRRRGNLSSVGSPRSARDDSYGVNFRKGKGGYLVLEADEWKAAFHHYSPFVATITNVDAEHLDFYKTFANVKKSFEKFKSQCHAVVERPKNKMLEEKIRRILKVPGEHNVQNALNAYALARFLNIPERTILSALGKYHGAWRRMEFRGYFNNRETAAGSKQSVVSNKKTPRLILNTSYLIPVFDDYAHHPSEIKATLAGFKQKWPKNALICVFQPHQGKRLKLLYNSFKTAFKAADRVVILPTYQVAGRESEKASKYNAKRLAQDIGATYVLHPEMDLKRMLQQITNNLITNNHSTPAIIVMMGAGTINDLTPTLLK
ncbi:MAG: Mur ligase domain-containing protein [bacterium]|nr:Mur ligase domain-containing protein [bacterium]